MEEKIIDKQINFLEEIDKYFTDYDEIFKTETEKQSRCHAEQEDYLHELELSKLNAVELFKLIKRMLDMRKRRRIAKNNVIALNVLKNLVNNYYKKGIGAEVKQTIENLKKLKVTQENLKYQVKVAEGLKIGEPKGENNEIPQ